MNREEVKNKVLAIAAEVFSSDKDNISEELEAGEIESWDSMGHLNLFLAIESKLKVKFLTEEIVAVDSLRKIIDQVSVKLK